MTLCDIAVINKGLVICEECCKYCEHKCGHECLYTYNNLNIDCGNETKETV